MAISTATFNQTVLFHDEELDEEELHKCFDKFTPETLKLIQQEYDDD